MLRRSFAITLVALATAGALSGCTPSGPDEAAERAAAAYAAELQDWSDELAEAVPRAKTWTQSEIDADAASGGEGGLPEEVGLGGLLDEAPVLQEFNASVVERTPVYREVVAVSERVDVVLAELRSLEPAEVKQLRAAGAATSLVAFELYDATFGGPALGRLEAYSASLDAGTITDEARTLLRESDAAFARERIGFLDAAIEAMRGTGRGSDDPLIPDSSIGHSVGAFVIDWYEEDRAFEERALAEIESWELSPERYGEFWGFEDLSSIFRVSVDRADELRRAHAATISTLAADAGSGGPASAFAGDAYRAILLDGYLPWGDDSEGAAHAVDRLWMLWRIRELDGTADAEYDAARAALLEELNRGIPDGTVRDHRPGSARVLGAVEALVEGAENAPDDREAGWDPLLARLAESVSFAERLREGPPMMGEVADGYDAMLAEVATARGELVELRDAPDPEQSELAADSELSVAFIRFDGDLQERLVPILSPSLSLLDDDARFSARLAELIEATRPAAADEAGDPSDGPARRE